MYDASCDVELKVPSDLIYLRPVRTFMRELAESVGFRHERAGDIELAVDEVFTNAVEHGSVGSESQIVILCSLTDRMMRITIRDTGRGGSTGRRWSDAWSDVVEEKTCSGTERGHGLFLAHNLMDEMSMESNSIGGVDVHLVIYKEGQQIAQE